MAQNEYYLMHYGVKGMKWGVRKAPDQVPGGRRTPSDKAELGESTNIAKQLSSGGSAYSSAGYDNNGERRYTENDFGGSVSKDTLKKAYDTADKRIVDYLGKDWKKQKDSDELYDLVLMEVLEELEDKEMHHSELYHYGVKGQKWGVRRTPEQLGYRSPAGKVALGKSTVAARGSSKSSFGSKFKQKLSDPEFQRKAATAAKIALVIGAAYATHKIINDPRILAAGKDAITKVAAKSGNVKASALKSVMNSTEFKVAKAAVAKVDPGSIKDAVKTVGGATGKALKKLGSEDMRNTISGIGAMAGTTAIVRSQIKDFRENKPDGDRFDRAVKRTQQMSEIGENINTLARGPKGQSGSNTTSSTSNSSSSKTSSHSASIPGIEPSKKGVDKSSKEYNDLFKGESQANREHIKKLVNAGYDVDQIRKYKKEFDSQFDHSAVSNSSSRRGNLMEDSRTGRVVRTNKPLTIKDSKSISDYQKAHPNKSLEQVLGDLDLLDKEYRHSAIACNGYYLAHSSVNTGWRMKRQQ